MKNDEVKSSFAAFLKVKDVDASNRLWDEKSVQFRKFWENYILDKNNALSEEVVDQAIRILDVNAKGHTSKDEAVAKVMVPQGAWRRMFNEIKQDERLRKTMDEIFKSEGEGLVTAIDNLYALNKNPNYLTGDSANAVNTMLFAFNPKKYISVVSLNDRQKIIEKFDFKNGPNFETDTPGKRILLSNQAIIDGFKSIGIQATPRIISTFLYQGIKEYWKPSIEIRINDEKAAEVIVPDDIEIKSSVGGESSNRRSITIQAKIAEIGEKLGFKIWLPMNDRTRVLKVWKPIDETTLLEELPSSFEGAARKTIMNIDVLWINRLTIVRAFEVEDTTSIYSGILRMADLLALLPNINIKIHIVAPDIRKMEVFTQINRPVFSLMEPKPLSQICTFIPYDEIEELAQNKKIGDMKESVIDSISKSSDYRSL